MTYEKNVFVVASVSPGTLRGIINLSISSVLITDITTKNSDAYVVLGQTHSRTSNISGRVDEKHNRCASTAGTHQLDILCHTVMIYYVERNDIWSTFVNC